MHFIHFLHFWSQSLQHLYDKLEQCLVMTYSNPLLLFNGIFYKMSPFARWVGTDQCESSPFTLIFTAIWHLLHSQNVNWVTHQWAKSTAFCGTCLKSEGMQTPGKKSWNIITALRGVLCQNAIHIQSITSNNSCLQNKNKMQDLSPKAILCIQNLEAVRFLRISPMKKMVSTLYPNQLSL